MDLQNDGERALSRRRRDPPVDRVAVTPSDLDRSYLMYKLTGQQASAMGGGNSMPRSGRLRDADLCKFIVWIKEGAK